jgi:hypothetical protein
MLLPALTAKAEAQARQPTPEYSASLNYEEWQVIWAALAERPYKDVALILQKLVGQIEPQRNPRPSPVKPE